jgi:hypothetical protein
MKIKDQGTTSYCTAYASTSASEYQEGIELSEEYTTAKEGEIQGTPIFNGTDPRTALTSGVKYGYLPKEQSPMNFFRDGWEQPAFWMNYPAVLDGQAITHRKDSYYSVTKTYQGIKEALFQAKNENGVVIICGRWFAEWNNPIGGIVPTPASPNITLHAYIAYDWVMCADGVERLKCQLSQGASFGDGGVLYLSPACITATFGNAWAGTGAFIFRDDTGQTNQAEEIAFYRQLIGLLQNILALLTPPPSPTVPPFTPHRSRIQEWALAIQHQEGGGIQDRNTRNRNPGNLKYTAYTQSLGASDRDSGNFCIFTTYDAGFKALCQFLTDACNGKLVAYDGEETLDQFTTTYAVPPNKNYVKGVANALGVPITTQIKDLL